MDTLTTPCFTPKCTEAFSRPPKWLSWPWSSRPRAVSLEPAVLGRDGRFGCVTWASPAPGLRQEELKKPTIPALLREDRRSVRCGKRLTCPNGSVVSRLATVYHRENLAAQQGQQSPAFVCHMPDIRLHSSGSIASHSSARCCGVGALSPLYRRGNGGGQSADSLPAADV